MAKGIIIAAPGSGSGKTTLTLALLERLREAGVAVASGKAGPDYIDPAFHAAATGKVCHNLDGWAMAPQTLAYLVHALEREAELVIVEGVMGLFDGAPDGRGSAADLSRLTGWPVVLVVDASGMARSAAALVHGFAHFDPQVRLAGVIFNRLGSPAHGELLRRAMAASEVPVLGCVTRNPALELPERHLGLVQASEHPDLARFLDGAARHVGDAVDLDALVDAARPATLAPVDRPLGVPPLGRRIGVARDEAFAFCYPYLLEAWRGAGSSVEFFSPLADEAPPPGADALFLPGGYPELHAGKLAAASRFLDGLRGAAGAGTTIYGECGGYMVLGRTLVAGDGSAHRMAGLLPVDTSFEAPRMSLGYRQLRLIEDSVLGKARTRYRGHEFHFASVSGGEACTALFHAFNAEARDLGPQGMRRGNVMGSFLHLIDVEGEEAAPRGVAL